MLQSILPEVEAKHPHQAVNVINRFVLMMPQILKHQLDKPVTLMGLYSARVRVAKKLKRRGLAQKLATVEVGFKPHHTSHRLSYTEPFLRDSFGFWLNKQIDTNTKLLNQLCSGKTDGPTLWEIRNCPNLNADHILLRRELSSVTWDNLGTGSLNFARLLETQAGALFPRLRV